MTAVRTLAVYADAARVGELTEAAGVWGFEYAHEWLASPTSYDLSPALARRARRIVDDSTRRSVQWFFDNLLPEERLREVVLREAGIRGDDAFALLAYLGAESAGSLTLLDAAAGPPSAGPGQLRPLSRERLSERIAGLPNRTLSSDAPKRMSLAGAQHKLLVRLIDDELWEPTDSAASTHILKPQHPAQADFPSTVVNEWLMMTLAKAAGLPVPAVHMLYVPEPVYIVERFDRLPSGRRMRKKAAPETLRAAPPVSRLHAIDACQLLDQPPNFKYSEATLETFGRLARACTTPAAARLVLWRWLVFNLLAGNDDAHLKNASFLVRSDELRPAAHYDLLSSVLYRTKSFAGKAGTWPRVEMPTPLPGAKTYGDVEPAVLEEAAQALEIPWSTAKRVVREVVTGVHRAWPRAQHRLANVHSAALATQPKAAKHFAEQLRLVRLFEQAILGEMAPRLTGSAWPGRATLIRAPAGESW